MDDFDLNAALLGMPIKMRNGTKIIELAVLRKAACSPVIVVTEHRATMSYNEDGSYGVTDEQKRTFKELELVMDLEEM